MKRFAVMLTLAAGLGLTLNACGDEGGVEASGADSAVTVPGAAVPQLSPADGAALLAARSDITVIDVRTPEEFAVSHLEGAVDIDVQAASFDDEVRALDPDGAYAVYCHSGRRSALAAARLVALGFTEVHDLGGIEAWVAAGNPVVTG